MALERKNFCTAANNASSNAPRIHSYRTTVDNRAAVNTAGYFNGLSKQVSVGDVIYAHVTDGYYFFPVVSNAAGVVDVADGLALGTTDSD